MKYRTLRIAWSVGWGLAAALLIVLWMVSYTVHPYLQTPTGIRCKSSNGVFVLLKLPAQATAYEPTGIITFRMPDGDKSVSVDLGPRLTWSGFQFQWDSGSSWYLQAPYWALVALTVLGAVLPWIRQLRWRFSLRTLLIATTLVAVVLGTIVWLSR
jgi:hypothetical protein